MENGCGSSQWRNGNTLQLQKQRRAGIRSTASGDGDSHGVLAPQSRRDPAAASRATSSAALDAYLAKYHVRLQPSGQQRHNAHVTDLNAVSTGRQSLSHDPLVVLPRETNAQPESPLSRFRKQAMCIAWKRSAHPRAATGGDDDRENLDSTNLARNPHKPLSVELTHLTLSAIDTKENQPVRNKQEERSPSHLLMTSVVAQALFDKVREAKLLGRQSKKISARHVTVVERQQPSFDQRAQRSSRAVDASETQKTGMTNGNIAADHVSDDRADDDTHVESVSAVPSPVSIARWPELDVTTTMLPSEHFPPRELFPRLDTRRETQQPKNVGGVPPSLSVEAVVRISNAAVAIQRAWRRNRHERELASFLRQTSDPEPGRHPSPDELDSPIEEPCDQFELLGVAFALPRPPIAVRNCVATAEAKQAKEASSDGDSASTVPVTVSERSGEDAAVFEASAVLPHMPAQALWVDDDWLCLEEGRYLGDLKAVLGSQSALSSIKSNDESFLIWRCPQTLIQRRERERVTWLQHLKRRKDALTRMAPNDSELCEVLQIDAASSFKAQTAESEEVGSFTSSETGEYANPCSKCRRATYSVPLPKWRHRRKRRAPLPMIRVLRRSTRREEQQRSQDDARLEVTEQLSACHLQSSSPIDAEEDEEEERCDAAALDVSRFVIFSSFASESHQKPKSDDRRNDLISIVDETERGRRSLSTASSESCRNDGCSHVEPGRLGEIEGCGFIPLNFAARDALTSTLLSSLSSAGSESPLDSSEKESKSTTNAVQVTREPTASSAFEDTSEDDRDRDRTGSTPLRRRPRRMISDTLMSENGRQELGDVDAIEAQHDEEPAKESLDNNRRGQVGNEASAAVKRLWQQGVERESYAPQFENEADVLNELGSPHGPLPVRVDVAMKEEFRRILDEFTESLRQSSSSSSSGLQSESLWSSDQWSNSELPSESSLLLTANLTQTFAASRDEGEDDDETVDEELQAMLHEINHFNQQLQRTIDNKVPQ